MATYRYQISTSGDVHTLSFQPGGVVIDKAEDSGKTTVLTIVRAGASYSMSGFGPSDFFDLDQWLRVVNDTTLPMPRTEYIHSIAAVNPKYGYGTVYAASDSLLYKIDVVSNAIDHPNPLPLRGLTLAEDMNGGGVYAFQLGGRGIFWTSDGGTHWISDSTPSGTGITAFTSSKYNGDVFWAACGGQLYEFTYFSILGKAVDCPLGRITALEATSDGVVAAGDDGNVYDVPRFGSAKLLGKAPAAITGIAGNYISTGLTGIFDYRQTGAPIVAGDDSAIYSTGTTIFAGRSDGSIDHFSSFFRDDQLAAPNPGKKVTQFAYPNQGELCVLAGGQIFSQRDSSEWVPVNQTLSSTEPFPPGALTLLRTDDTTWLAGYIESSYKGVLKGYGYRASAFGPFPQVVLDGVAFNDVLIVNYTTESNGKVDELNVPQYNIYFQNGVGPIRFERTWNGKTITTRLLK